MLFSEAVARLGRYHDIDDLMADIEPQGLGPEALHALRLILGAVVFEDPPLVRGFVLADLEPEMINRARVAAGKAPLRFEPLGAVVDSIDTINM